MYWKEQQKSMCLLSNYLLQKLIKKENPEGINELPMSLWTFGVDGEKKGNTLQSCETAESIFLSDFKENNNNSNDN